MKGHDMAYYLEDLNRVRALSFEKLGEWKEKYPYSQMVHFLMAKKHQLEGLTDDMSIFHKASFYAVDREHLYNRMTASECEKEDEDEWISRAELQVDMQEVQEEEQSLEKEEIKKEEVVDQINELDKKVEILTTQEDSTLSPFANWLSTLQPLSNETSEVVIDNKDAKQKKKKKSKKKHTTKDKLEAKIKSSVIKQDEIVSGPLAKILAQQGHTEKAVKMYKKLSLIFPEKSSFFASQIEKIINSK